MRVLRRSGSSFLVVALMMAVGSCARLSSPSAAATASATINLDAQSAALAAFQTEYGQVDDVYASAVTTLAAWREAEPSNTSGLDVGEGENSTLMYVLFLHGSFEVEDAPMGISGTPGGFAYDEARIVFGDDGKVLSTRLWVSAAKSAPFTTGDPPIGQDFDDR